MTACTLCEALVTCDVDMDWTVKTAPMGASSSVKASWAGVSAEDSVALDSSAIV